MSICADKAGVNVGQSLFTDIDYADDEVLLTENDAQWKSILESFDAAANTMGFHTSWAKTKIQNVASGPSPPSCVISGHHVEAVNRFTHLGSNVELIGLLYTRNSREDQLRIIHYVPAGSCLDS